MKTIHFEKTAAGAIAPDIFVACQRKNKLEMKNVFETMFEKQTGRARVHENNLYNVRAHSRWRRSHQILFRKYIV